MSHRCLNILMFAVLVSSLGCSHLLYYPTTVEHLDRTKIPRQPQDVHFQLKDGTDIHAWYFDADPKREPVARVLFLHGNGQNLTTHFAGLYWILDSNVDYLIVDYPGYGKSGGKPTPANTVETGKAALAWMQTRFPGARVVVFGQSLGGAVALRTVADLAGQNTGICLTVVDSTFLYYSSVARDALNRHWVTWPLQWLAPLTIGNAFAPGEKIKQIAPIPLIVIHGRADGIVSFKRGEQVFAAAAEPKEFWPVDDAGHIQAFWSPTNGAPLRKRLLERIETHCSTTDK